MRCRSNGALVAGTVCHTLPFAHELEFIPSSTTAQRTWNASLCPSMSTSVSFSWHDSYSCVSADCSRTTAVLFFCLPALLTELWSPSEALWYNPTPNSLGHRCPLVPACPVSPSELWIPDTVLRFKPILDVPEKTPLLRLHFTSTPHWPRTINRPPRSSKTKTSLNFVLKSPPGLLHHPVLAPQGCHEPVLLRLQELDGPSNSSYFSV